jgi:tetratricopeptide (TPR) repeat protein
VAAAALALIGASVPGGAMAADFDTCWAALQNSKFAEAAPCFEGVVKDSPDWSWGHTYLGQSYLGLGKKDLALAEFQKAMDTTVPDDSGIEPFFYAAQILADKKQAPVAMEALKRGEAYLANARPEHQGDYVALRGRVNFELGKHAQAVADLKKSGRKDFATLYLLGLASYKAEDFTTATEALETALRAKPDDAGAAQYLSLAYYRRAENTSDGRTRDQLYAKAADVGRVMIQKNPGSVEGHDLLGKALMGANDLAGAEEHFKKVLEMQPGHCTAQANMAQVALARAQNDKAIEMATKALACLKGDQKREVHLTLGHAFSAKAKAAADAASDTDVKAREDAIASYERAVKEYQSADAIRSTSATTERVKGTRDAIAGLRAQIATIQGNVEAMAANKEAEERERQEQERRKKLEEELRKSGAAKP